MAKHSNEPGFHFGKTMGFDFLAMTFQLRGFGTRLLEAEESFTLDVEDIPKKKIKPTNTAAHDVHLSRRDFPAAAAAARLEPRPLSGVTGKPGGSEARWWGRSGCK